jgi:hypothetical protein
MADLKTLKQQSEKAQLPEASLFVLKQMEAKLEASLAFVRSYFQERCLTWADKAEYYTTKGGSATEIILDPNVYEDQPMIATLNHVGASPVTLKSARAEAGQIVLEFSANPGNDHGLTYVLFKYSKR